MYIKRQHRAVEEFQTVLRRTSNAIFNMKKVDLDESSLNR